MYKRIYVCVFASESTLNLLPHNFLTSTPATAAAAATAADVTAVAISYLQPKPFVASS